MSIIAVLGATNVQKVILCSYFRQGTVIYPAGRDEFNKTTFNSVHFLCKLLGKYFEELDLEPLLRICLNADLASFPSAK